MADNDQGKAKKFNIYKFLLQSISCRSSLAAVNIQSIIIPFSLQQVLNG